MELYVCLYYIQNLHCSYQEERHSNVERKPKELSFSQNTKFVPEEADHFKSIDTLNYVTVQVQYVSLVAHQYMLLGNKTRIRGKNAFVYGSYFFGGQKCLLFTRTLMHIDPAIKEVKT